MNISDWLAGYGDYQDGLRLLVKHTNNTQLLKQFAQESALNRMKMRIALSNIAKTQTLKTVKTKQSPVLSIVDKSPEKAVTTKKPISAYPKELHEIYQLRINSFLRASSLKVELNAVPEDDELSALELQTEIWKQLEVNKKCWQILDHYDTTGQVLPTKSTTDFSKLSPMEMVKQRQRLYVNVSKRKKTIENIELQISEEDKPGKIERLKSKLFQKKYELQELQNDIDKLSNLINNG